jgi:hypothetical protein
MVAAQVRAIFLSVTTASSARGLSTTTVTRVKRWERVACKLQQRRGHNAVSLLCGLYNADQAESYQIPQCNELQPTRSRLAQLMDRLAAKQGQLAYSAIAGLHRCDALCDVARYGAAVVYDVHCVAYGLAKGG